MAPVTRQLRDLFPQLVEAATFALARGEHVRQIIESELARFYELLLEACTTGSPTGLDSYLKGWVESRPAHLAGEDITSFLPALHALKSATQRVLGEQLSPEEALNARDSLGPLFDYATETLARMERDAALAEMTDEINEARRHLESLDKSKSDFIAVAAHELKTPLTLIEGYSNMLAEEFAGKEQPRAQLMLGGIENGTRRLREIIEDMIDVSMIDNDMLSLTYQPVWLNRLLEIAEVELEDALKQRGHTLQVDRFPGSNTMTYADPERIYQVLINVLGNAIKYTPDNGHILVSGRELPGFVEVTISDNGIGIPPELHDEIFEKFSRIGDVSLHSTGKTKFKGGGPGLGLPIARGIIEAHGGTIWVESPGYDEETCPGSTFHIMVPVRDKPPAILRKPSLFGLTEEEKQSVGIIE